MMTKVLKLAGRMLVPGIGQIYNGQKIKGLFFLGIFLVFLGEIFFWGSDFLNNIITLGKVPIKDNSLFYLVEGTIQILIIVVFLFFWIISMVDVRNVKKKKEQGEKINRTIKEHWITVSKQGFPYLLTIPAYIFMLISIVFPVLVSILISFTNYDFEHTPPAQLLNWVGLDNFSTIVTNELIRNTFFKVLEWTLIWTFTATTLQIVIGITLAVILNKEGLKFKRIFGVIFLLPWAVPAFITIMSFSNIFSDSAGAINTQVIPLINTIFPFFDLTSIPWKTDPFWTKVAIVLVQGWIGFPYIYIMVSGILQSIPKDLYEAATVDGATSFQRFRSITLPSILLIAAPTFITQYVGNFNNFSTIYLFNNGGPGSVGVGAGETDILISWIYKLVTGNSPQYSFAAAVTLVISFFIIASSLLVFKRTKAFKLED